MSRQVTQISEMGQNEHNLWECRDYDVQQSYDLLMGETATQVGQLLPWKPLPELSDL